MSLGPLLTEIVAILPTHSGHRERESERERQSLGRNINEDILNVGLIKFLLFLIWDFYCYTKIQKITENMLKVISK